MRQSLCGWASVLTLSILILGCQGPKRSAGEKPRSKLFTSLELLRDGNTEAKKQEPWLKAATLGADYKADVETPLWVALKKEACEFDRQQREFDAQTLWSPLPMTLLTPGVANAKLNETFASSLRFTEGYSNEKLIRFVVWFNHGSIYWKSIWKIVPEIVTENGKTVCRVKTEICDVLGKDDNGATTCSDKWRWLRAIMAEPDRVQGFLGRVVLTGLRAEWMPTGKSKVNLAAPFTLPPEKMENE
jgi:hypothetical protein